MNTTFTSNEKQAIDDLFHFIQLFEPYQRYQIFNPDHLNSLHHARIFNWNKSTERLTITECFDCLLLIIGENPFPYLTTIREYYYENNPNNICYVAVDIYSDEEFLYQDYYQTNRLQRLLIQHSTAN